MNATEVGIVGATSWGATLARLFDEAGTSASIWARTDADLARLSDRPGTPLAASTDASRLSEARIVVYAVPSASLAWNLERTLPNVGNDAVILSAIKGIDPDSCLRMSEVIAAAGVDAARIAVLSGPNLSSEIEAGMPAAAVVASAAADSAKAVQSHLHGPRYRVYTSDDVVGVEIAGALKNVAAIACGISDGMGYGANARAGLMTRALAEMTRLGVVLGARPTTFFGLAGVGDLIATCGSDLSRNRRVGMALARGSSLVEALAAAGGVAEGVPTTAAARRLAKEHGVEMPIAEELDRVLYEAKSPAMSMEALLSREVGEEFPRALN